MNLIFSETNFGWDLIVKFEIVGRLEEAGGAAPRDGATPRPALKPHLLAMNYKVRKRFHERDRCANFQRDPHDRSVKLRHDVWL